MGRTGRVLVVDDDVAVRLRVRDLLEPLDLCEVAEATSGPEALADVARRPPDLILLDLMMPGMSGLEVCSALRGDPATREIPIIVLSAGDETTAMPAALEAGAEDYLRKPIPGAELRAKVRTTLRLNRYHALHLERRRLRWLVEHSADALLIVDSSGALAEANIRARALFDLPAAPASDALGLLARHYQADPPDALARLRARARADGANPPPAAADSPATADAFPDASPHEFALLRPESRFAAARWFQVQVFHDPATPAGDLLLKITDRSAAVHRELESWTFQHLLSHKLRTPLNGLGSTLDLLAEDPELRAGPEGAEFVEAARESARRLEASLLSILRYHQTLCSPAPVTAEDAAVGATLAAEAGAPASWETLLRDVAATIDLGTLHFASSAPAAPTTPPATPPALPAAWIAPLRIALSEVFANYLKFSDAARAGLDARFVAPERLRFFAPGPALPPDVVAQLGRPYWQVEKTFSGEVPGMGLGLATARLLLRSLGADLVFSSSADTPGLVTELRLPAPPARS